MADIEDKEKAEKLAAAKKRVEQLKKQKDKSKKLSSSQRQEDQQHAREESTEHAAAGHRESSLDPNHDQENTASHSLTEDAEPSNIAGSGEPTPTLPKQTHNRQPSLSVESKLRSSSFRRTSVSQAPLSPPLNGNKSPILPILTTDGESVNEIYRKQTAKLDELEKENRRLAKEIRDVELRWQKTEEELEDLRESSSEVAELKSRAGKADSKAEENEKLKQENTSLQRQVAQLQSQSSKSIRHASSPSQAHNPSFPTSELQAQLESKSSTIESMEMEISSLRSQLDKSASTSSSHSDQVSALEEKSDRAERAAGAAQRELIDLKKSLDRASEKAVKEGSERTSAETKIRSLEREVDESKRNADDSLKRLNTLEKKLAALTTLHKESDGRRQAGEKERDKVVREAAELRRRLSTVENETLRLHEERERSKKREASGADDGVDELEDEERHRLEAKVRSLESEVFDLRRGIWRDRRRNLSGPEVFEDPASPGSKFDEVDLSSGGPTSSFRRQSFAANRGQSGFTNVLSSGFNAITGGGGGQRESQELLDGFDDGFDEDAFRAAQEEEARKRVERVREVKRGLKEWEGWRMDVVDCRLGGGGAGEIFDV